MIPLRSPNRLDTLILSDVQEHPGSSKEQVISRMLQYYQSYTYIRNRINRLIQTGHLIDRRDAEGLTRCSLYCADGIPAR